MTDNQTEKQKVQELTDKDVELTMMDAQKEIDALQDSETEINKSQEQQEVYGDNVFEKDGIRRDRTGDGEKTRCLCGKRGIFNRDGPAMGPQIIRQLE